VHHSKNVNSAWNRTVEDDDSLEPGDSKDSQRLKRRMFQGTVPSDFRLCRKKSKSLVCGDKESMAQFRASFGSVIDGLFFEVAVGSWPDRVGRAHLVSVFFSR